MLVSKWGNSLAVRLPKQLIKNLGLGAGDELAIVAASKAQLAVAKRDRRKEALGRMKARRWKQLPGYRFDRDEANRR